MGLVGSINIEPDMVIETEASTGLQAIEQFRKTRPDIILMDIGLPGLNAPAESVTDYPGVHQPARPAGGRQSFRQPALLLPLGGFV